MSKNDYIEEMLEIQGVIIKKCVNTEVNKEIHIELERKEQICPCCKTKTSYIHDYRTQVIKDTKIFNKNVVIVYRKRRYICNNCTKRFYEANDFLAKYSRMTKRAMLTIIDMLKESVTMKYVSKQIDVSPTTVSRVFNQVNYSLINALPEVLSIDEFKGNAERKYQCILTDPANRKVVDIVKGREFDVLTDYFKSFKNRDNVKFFVMDMWRPFKDIAETYFKNATIIIDKFHYIRHVMWDFDNVRKQLQKKLSPERRKYFKRSKSLLHAYYPSLKPDDRRAVDVMLSLSNELTIAHSLKELFLNFVYEKDYNLAVKKVHEWFEVVDLNMPIEFSKSKNTIINWLPYILNSIKYKYTNGFTEGFNNKIKVLKRVSYGFRNFNRFRNRILHLI